ncbi:MAG: ABC transporter permease [Mycobacteriales bacterium]
MSVIITEPTATEAGVRPTARSGPFRSFMHAMLRSKTGFIGFVVFTLLVLMALFGPLIVTPEKVANVNEIFQAPGWSHLLGTDNQGKDNLRQIIGGGRDVIVVGLVSALVSTVIAVLFGALAAYVRGWLDSLAIQLADFVLTIPQFVLLAVLSAYVRFSSTIWLAVLIGLLSWPGLLRAVRAQVLSLKEREYVEAARLMDLGTFRIIVREMMPNMASYLLINFITAMTGAVYSLAGLYLLGLAPMSGTNWGIMINESWTGGAIYNPSSAFWLLSPLIAISLLQLSAIWMMRSLEEIANPRLREAA